MHYVEPKAQRWCAIVVFRDGKEGLLVLGPSHHAVKETYAEPWFDLYDDREHSYAKEIRLQKFIGAPDRGYWKTEGVLPIPAPTRD